MKRKPLVALGAALIVFSALFILAGGLSSYDVQSLGLVFVRLNMWVLAVVFYPKLMALMGDDDLEEDWKRINDGNTAVAAYRGVEFAIVGIAAALLIFKI